MQPTSLVIHKRRLQQLRFFRCLRVTSVYRAHKTRHVTSTIQKLIKGMQRTGLNRHRQGYATKEAGNALHFPVSGPIGLARSQVFNIKFIIIFIITLISIISFKILYSRVSEALNFYRVYSTKQSIRSYHTSYQGISRNLEYQTYLMHLGIKQFLIT